MLANVIAIMPVKIAALIQMKIWIKRRFSSCNSTETSSTRSWTVASTLSARARTECRKPGESAGGDSIAEIIYLLRRPRSTPTSKPRPAATAMAW